MKKQMKEKVTSEVAQEEANLFFASLNLSELKLSKMEEEKQSLVELIQYGFVVIDEDGKLTYLMQYPLKNESGNVVLDKLVFVNRKITVGEMEKNLTGKNDIEKARKILAYLTKTNSQFFSKMDDDFVALGSISAFFLPR
jgi:hypothetical protein